MPSSPRTPSERTPRGRASSGGRGPSRPGARASRPSRAGSAKTGATASVRGREVPRSTGRQPERGPGWPFSAQRRLGLTGRAFVLAAAVVLVFVMITPSLGVYFNQKAQLSRLAVEEAQHKASISSLQDELNRWNDPNYVRIQARTQLGWVVPGETGYRVIGKDGKVLGAGVSLGSADDSSNAASSGPWWQKMVGSVKTADTPRTTSTQTPR